MGWLLSLLGFLNPLKPIYDEIKGAISEVQRAQTDKERLAAQERLEYLRQQATVQVAAMQHDRWFSARNLISYSVAFYVAKLFVWDTVLGLGVTQNPGDIVNWIAAEVIAALFVSKTASIVAGAFAQRFIRNAGG